MSKFLFTAIVLIIMVAYALQSKSVEKATYRVLTTIETPNLVNKDSLSILTRVNPPKGYKRVNYKKGSFQEYLRNYNLKPFGSKIMNYDDSYYFWQGGHVGVLEIPVPKNGLQ